MGRSSIDLYANEIGAAFVDIRSFAAYVGGSSTNIAVGARRLGLQTALLTAVGADPVGDFILHFLEREQVETKYIPRKKDARSSAVILGIEPPDKFPLVFYRDNAADIQLTIDDVRSTPVTSCRLFGFAGTNLSKEPSRSATLFAAERAHAAGVAVLMDLDLRPDQWYDPRAFGVSVRAVLPLVDIVLGTEEETKAAVLTGRDRIRVTGSQVSSPEVQGDLEQAVAEILSRGPHLLVVKRGAQGSTLYAPDAPPRSVPGFPVEVFNVLGAGDAFAAGFIYGTLHGWDGYRAARMGNACGAIVVTRHGCANFMPYETEALDFIAEHGGF